MISSGSFQQKVIETNKTDYKYLEWACNMSYYIYCCIAGLMGLDNSKLNLRPKGPWANMKLSRQLCLAI